MPRLSTKEKNVQKVKIIMSKVMFTLTIKSRKWQFSQLYLLIFLPPMSACDWMNEVDVRVFIEEKVILRNAWGISC
jgi:hypothetical protein